jgi:hypothetical protein
MNESCRYQTFGHSCSGKLLEYLLESTNISPHNSDLFLKINKSNESYSPHRQALPAYSVRCLEHEKQNQCGKLTTTFHKCRNTFLLQPKKKFFIYHLRCLCFISNINYKNKHTHPYTKNILLSSWLPHRKNAYMELIMQGKHYFEAYTHEIQCHE